MSATNSISSLPKLPSLKVVDPAENLHNAQLPVTKSVNHVADSKLVGEMAAMGSNAGALLEDFSLERLAGVLR